MKQARPAYQMDCCHVLGWRSLSRPTDACEEDLVEFLNDCLPEVIAKNHEWLHARERSTREIREDLFGIRKRDAFRGRASMRTINEGMYSMGYESRGGSLDRLWSCNNDY